MGGEMDGTGMMHVVPISALEGFPRNNNTSQDSITFSIYLPLRAAWRIPGSRAPLDFEWSLSSEKQLDYQCAQPLRRDANEEDKRTHWSSHAILHLHRQSAMESCMLNLFLSPLMGTIQPMRVSISPRNPYKTS